MSDSIPSAKHNWLAVAATLIVLFLLGLFSWRIVYFATRIQSGEVFATPSFLSQYSPSISAASIPIPDGAFDVDTDDDPSLGSPDAPVVIVEFADFGCPFSRESSFAVRATAAKWGDQVRYVYRDFPIVELHPDAQKAAEAGECAQDQGKFWEYHDKLYLNQNNMGTDMLVQFATELNMDTRAFEDCLESGKYADEVAQDYQDGVTAGVRGTPTFFLNGNRVPGAIPEDVLNSLIERLLAS